MPIITSSSDSHKNDGKMFTFVADEDDEDESEEKDQMEFGGKKFIGNSTNPVIISNFILLLRRIV
jgi:hypothetical protein